MWKILQQSGFSQDAQSHRFNRSTNVTSERFWLSALTLFPTTNGQPNYILENARNIFKLSTQHYRKHLGWTAVTVSILEWSSSSSGAFCSCSAGLWYAGVIAYPIVLAAP